MSKEKNKIIEICAELLDKNNKNKLMNIVIDLEKKEYNPNRINEKNIATVFFFCAIFLAGISIGLGVCSYNKGFLLCMVFSLILTGFGSYYYRINEKDIALIFFFFTLFLVGISIGLGVCSYNKGFLLCMVFSLILTGFGSYYYRINEKDIALIFFFFTLFLVGISIGLGVCSYNKGFLLCMVFSLILTGFGSHYHSKSYNKKNYKKIYNERNNKKEEVENCYIKIKYYQYRWSLYLIRITEGIKNNRIIKKFCSVLEEETMIYTFLTITLTLLIEILLPKEIEIRMKIVNMLTLIILIPIEVTKKIMLKFIKSII